MFAVFNPSPPRKLFGDGMRLISSFKNGRVEGALRSASLKVLQFATGAPLKLQLPNKPIADSGPVAVEGVAGLPLTSTDGIAPLAFWLPAVPGKYRMMPAF